MDLIVSNALLPNFARVQMLYQRVRQEKVNRSLVTGLSLPLNYDLEMINIIRTYISLLDIP
jgi:hypothetical protein